ncbi:hypothetical protein B0H65DRAFT_508813 [Neurospora tetraspora]|uniref:Uncharacterized protein n=1 Tax=Neurospora tetraspora TaxID=94610 RepID=A0AAE0JFG9_9PEZI|nr:hypothetical protein B0H65DRAFT_508813 [Neurospora tetraspora]
MHTKGTELATGKVSKAVEPLATSCRSLCASSQVPAIVARSLQGGANGGGRPGGSRGAEMNCGRQVGFGARGLRDRPRCSLLDEPLAQFSQRKMMVRQVPFSMSTPVVSVVYKNRHRDASDPRWFKKTLPATKAG